MNFCTLFNLYYLHKGLATYLSLEKVTDDFHLYVMAFDKECYDKLKSYNLKHLTVELLDGFETPELLAVKTTRNMAEYCWTCSAAITYYFINKFNLSAITYLDADLYFLSSPQILFDEIGEASIALSEHWFHYHNDRAGRFCVQFVYFKNNQEGMSALRYWRDSCIEWCFARYEDGKFGDQSYITDIYDKYKNVHVIKHRGCGLAPWNYKHYNFIDHKNLAYNNIIYPVVFFHFHGIVFKLNGGNELILTSGDGAIPKQTEDYFYRPYLELMKEIYNMYFATSIQVLKIEDISVWKKIRNRIKHNLHDNSIARFFYYKVFNIKYNGYEKNNI